MSKKCPVCGAPMEGDACGYCGYQAQIQQPYSSQQQVGVQPQIIINNNNQTFVNQNFNYAVSTKSKTVALILCIFFGIFGAHRFYVGKKGTGFIYLFSYGLFFVGWIYDLIKIIMGTFTDKYGLPLKRK